MQRPDMPGFGPGRRLCGHLRPRRHNLLTGIASAYMDSIPLVVITGQVRSDLLGRDVFQEADITGAAEPFTKHSYIVKKAADLPRVFKEAFHIASTGRPGPGAHRRPHRYAAEDDRGVRLQPPGGYHRL